MDNLHSQMVNRVKIILPMIALGLLSTLFLFSQQSSTQSELSFAEIQAIAEDQRMTAPHFSGLTDDGATMEIKAHSARPDPTDLTLIDLDQVVIHLGRKDGSQIEATATAGKINSVKNTAELSGLVFVETSDHYQMETNRLIADIDGGTITSSGLLEVHAPFGQLTAGQVTFYDDRNNVGQQMVFTQGVHLLYQPDNANRQD